MPWNPEKSVSTRFKTNKPESCIAHIGLKVPPSIKAKLKKKEGWRDRVREFLAEEVKDID